MAGSLPQEEPPFSGRSGGKASLTELGGTPEQEVSVIHPLPGQVSRSVEVLGVLTKAILENELPPGTTHSAVSLAQRLNVSKTPVREALLQLVTKGLVTFERGVGVRISETSNQDLVQIFQARLWLEPPATRLAAARVGQNELGQLRREFERMLAAGRARHEYQLWDHDRAFHEIVLSAGGNLQVARYVNSLREVAVLHRATFAALRSADMVDVATNHEPVLKALEAHDMNGAEEAMYRHVFCEADLVAGPEARDAVVEAAVAMRTPPA